MAAMDVDESIPIGWEPVAGTLERTLSVAQCGCTVCYGMGRGPSAIYLRCQRCMLQEEAVDRGGPDYSGRGA